MVLPTTLLAKISISISMSINIMILLLSVLLLAENSLAEGGADGGNATIEFGTVHDESGEEVAPAHAVLFPSFILTLGVLVYYFLSRYLHCLPYTAVMFLLGTIMGLVAASELVTIPGKHEYYMRDTLFAWQSINSEVLLLVFLPGLIFKDALGQNAYLFSIAIWQLLLFAFPLVLAGTALTACIGYYIFPYQWSFPLCLTFGSILAATDPVAVAALLEEVGAPPRLKTHVAGESLLNDGAAIVFFFIFSNMFFSEFGIEGFGEEIDFAEGVKIFVQKAVGGTAIGLVIGGAIILLMSLLNRRFGREENIVQVTAVLGMVYLGYFVADLVCKTSGVIATVAAGLVVKFFGRGSINDIHLMDDFFAITEHILNTILFCLGGLVWGRVIIDNHKEGYWSGKDWGYLILLYVLLHVIRALLFVSVFPITKRIGLGTSWAETTFQIYGGLRGAVGIALAIALDNEVREYKNNPDVDTSEEEKDVAQVYLMIGGVAFLTLFINGATAGPFLKWLGLADSTEAREKIIEAYQVHLRAQQIESFVMLLTNERYKYIDFSFVQEHIPFLADLTLEQLVEVVEKLKDKTPSSTYRPPYLDSVLSIVKHEEGFTSAEFSDTRTYDILKESPEMFDRKRKMEKRKRGRASTCRSSMLLMMKGDPLSTKELRLLFISMLRAQYENQVNEGSLVSQHGLTMALHQSLELAEAEVNDGGKLNDLHHLQKMHSLTLKYSVLAAKASCKLRHGRGKKVEDMDLHGIILMEMAFTNSHVRAQEFFQEELGESDKDLSEAGKIVIAESKKQVVEVRKDLRRHVNDGYVTEISTHKFCDILLSKGIKYVEKLVKFGLLKDSEAEEMIEEMIHLQKEVKHAKCNTMARKLDPLEIALSLRKSENYSAAIEDLSGIVEGHNEFTASNGVDGSKEAGVDVDEAEAEA